MTGNPLDPLLKPRSVALIGASPRAGSVGNDMLKVIIKQFMGGLVTRVAPVAEARLRAKTVDDVPALRGQVDRLLEEKLEELTPEIVKSMMERVIRDHLGWLIVWGNVFGAAIGLLARGIAVHWHL